jgi:hypothetical protein
VDWVIEAPPARANHVNPADPMPVPVTAPWMSEAIHRFTRLAIVPGSVAGAVPAGRISTATDAGTWPVGAVIPTVFDPATPVFA